MLSRMADITLAQATTLRDNWFALLTKLSTSPAQSVTFEGRSYTSKNTAEVSAEFSKWESKVSQLTIKSKNRTRAVRVVAAW